MNSAALGLGVSLDVNIEVKPMRKMLNALNRTGRLHLVTPETAHITVVNPNEVDISTNECEQGAIGLAHQDIVAYMSQLSVSELVLKSRGDSLERFGNHLAVPIVENESLSGIRDEISMIIEEHTGYKISNRCHKDHFSVGKMKKMTKATPKRFSGYRQ